MEGHFMTQLLNFYKQILPMQSSFWFLPAVSIGPSSVVQVETPQSHQIHYWPLVSTDTDQALGLQSVPAAQSPSGVHAAFDFFIHAEN